MLEDLEHDSALLERLDNFDQNLDNVENLVQEICSYQNYDEMVKEDKIKYDLFLSFIIGSLYWFYLRSKGVDPNEHSLKGELKRVQEYMVKSKKLYERNTIMPRINQAAAKRFIRNGLFDPDLKNTDKVDDEENKTISENPDEDSRPSKRLKLSDDS